MKSKVYCPECGEVMEYVGFTHEYTRAGWPDNYPVVRVYSITIGAWRRRDANDEIVYDVYYCPDCLIGYIVA